MENWPSCSVSAANVESFPPTPDAPSSLHAAGEVTPLDDASHAQPHLASLSLGPTLDPKPPSVGLSSTSRAETASEPSNEFEKDKTHFGIPILQASPVAAEDAEAEEGSSDIPFKPELCGNRGSPLQEHTEAPITDGFGLCWGKAKVLSKRLYQMGVNCLTQNVKCPEEICKGILAGKLKESPFAGKCLEDLRKSWALRVGCADFEAFLSRPTGQPFHLSALSRAAEALEDPDWAILTEGQDSFTSGVPVGFGEPIPRVPQVFARKEKRRKLDESELDYDRANYKSAEMSSEEG